MGATTNKPPTTVLVTSSRAYLMLALDGPSPRGRERGWPWCCVMSRHVKAGHVPIRGRTIIACIETTRVRALGFSPISTGGSEIAWLRLGLLHTAVRAETWYMDASLPHRAQNLAHVASASALAWRFFWQRPACRSLSAVGICARASSWPPRGWPPGRVCLGISRAFFERVKVGDTITV